MKTPEQILDALGKPFPRTAIKQRKGGGGKMYSYVEGHTVINRLNSATNGEWSFRIHESEWRSDLLIVVGELTIPGLGTRTGYGVQKIAPNSGEDLVKGASSDALKKAATLFGVALELYGSDYEAVPEATPQVVHRPQEPPQQLRPTLDTYEADPAWQTANRRLHAAGTSAGMDHDMLHAGIVANGFPSIKAAPPQELQTFATAIENDPVTLKAWAAKLLEAQAQLMPGVDVLPGPDPARYTN